MKKIIRLTENDLMKLVKRVIKEQQSNQILFTQNCSKKLSATLTVQPNSVVQFTFPTERNMSDGGKNIQDIVIEKVNRTPNQVFELPNDATKEQKLFAKKVEEIVISARLVYDKSTGYNDTTCGYYMDAVSKRGIIVDPKDPNQNYVFRSIQPNPNSPDFKGYRDVQLLLTINVPKGITINSNLQSELFN